MDQQESGAYCCYSRGQLGHARLAIYNERESITSGSVAATSCLNVAAPAECLSQPTY